MLIPSQIDIQIIDKNGHPNPVENVLFGLKIFINENSWHNYSVFKSDKTGHITLTRKDIIDNTELKWETKLLSNNPTRFELYIWEGRLTENMITMTKHLLELYVNKEFIEQDLKRHGLQSDNPQVLDTISAKSMEDKSYYEFIKNAVNNRLKVETPTIGGIWNVSDGQLYKFTIELI